MIKIKLLDIINKKDRNLNWLANSAGITYSTLYNFAHQNTNSVTYDILEKLCSTLKCNIHDIIEYIPTGVDILPESTLDMLKNITDSLLIQKTSRSQNNKISKEDQNLLYELIMQIIDNPPNKLSENDFNKFNKILAECFVNSLLPPDLVTDVINTMFNPQ